MAGLGLAVLRARVPHAERIALVGCAASALALASLEKDLHGASLIAGMLLAAAVLASSRASRYRRSDGRLPDHRKSPADDHA